MTRPNRRGRGFTLVEILIVVVILGILAAIVIPQFTNASQEASAASLKSMLQTCRSQIELYRVKNNGTLPDLGTDGGGDDWDVLVTGQYLQQAPINPFTSTSDIGTAESVDVGWVWDSGTGSLTAPYFDEVTNIYAPP